MYPYITIGTVLNTIINLPTSIIYSIDISDTVWMYGTENLIKYRIFLNMQENQQMGKSEKLLFICQNNKNIS